MSELHLLFCSCAPGPLPSYNHSHWYTLLPLYSYLLVFLHYQIHLFTVRFEATSFSLTISHDRREESTTSRYVI